MDAYTYLFHGEVFASLQSGNVILLGLNLAEGHFGKSLAYLIPILCFILGAGFASIIEQFFTRSGIIIWQQLSVLTELLGVLAIDLLLPSLSSHVITSLLSLFAAFQVHTFRTLNHHPYNTTMTTGNLRTVGASLMSVLTRRGDLQKNQILLRDSFFVAASFGVGAYVSTKLIPIMGQQALLGVVGLLLIVFLLMAWDQHHGRTV